MCGFFINVPRAWVGSTLFYYIGPLAVPSSFSSYHIYLPAGTASLLSFHLYQYNLSPIMTTNIPYRSCSNYLNYITQHYPTSITFFNVRITDKLKLLVLRQVTKDKNGKERSQG